MSKSSRKSSNDLLKTVGGVALILILFVVILRAALAPLYQEVAQIEERQDQQSIANSEGSSNHGGSGNGGDGGGGSNEDINVNLGGVGGLFNWALGWAWGGPGWYSGPDYGWWGANVWNGWRNWWNGDNWNGNNHNWNGGNNHDWNGRGNDSGDRNFQNNRFDHSHENHQGWDQQGRGGGEDFRREDGDGHREFHEGGGGHGGGHEGGRR